jgi:LytS/YehU family sensor histidine kinase
MFSLIVLICTLEFVQIRIDILKYTANADIDFQNGTLRFNFFGIFFRDTLFVAFFTMFKIYRDAIKSYKILQEKTYLERINFINQIEMQKSKINTHFFFNTLHSIQAMAANKSDNTAEALNNLSLLMKYIVVDSEDIMISLQKEIIFLQRYIELEKIRKPDVNLKFEVDGNANNYLVPPMIFEAFVNNAFKYNDHLANGLIEIKISCQGKDILFICQNAVDKSIKPSVSSTGKGLQNTINRLNLHYKNHHQLEIDDNEKYYSLSLLLKGRF